MKSCEDVKIGRTGACNQGRKECGVVKAVRVDRYSLNAMFDIKCEGAKKIEQEGGGIVIH